MTSLVILLVFSFIQCLSGEAGAKGEGNKCGKSLHSFRHQLNLKFLIRNAEITVGQHDFFFSACRRPDPGREHPRAVEPGPHRHHRPGAEPELRPPCCRARPQPLLPQPAAHHVTPQEDQAPGGPGGRNQSGVGALWRPLGNHRLRCGADLGDDGTGEERRATIGHPLAAGGTERDGGTSCHPRNSK